MPTSTTAAAPASSASTAPATPAPTPEAIIQTEITNTLALEQKLSDTIDDLKTRREAGDSTFVVGLAKELAIVSVPLNVDTATAYKAWKTSDGALAAKAKASEEALEAVRRHICRLEHTQPEAMRSLLERREAELKADLKEVQDRLDELDKSGSKRKPAKAS